MEGGRASRTQRSPIATMGTMTTHTIERIGQGVSARAMMPADTDARVLCAVTWPAHWEALGDIQDFASRYVRRHWSGELAERVRMSASELVDNAMRYATASTDIRLVIVDVPGGFALEVTNDAVESRIVILRKRVQETVAEDASGRYGNALRRLVSSPGTPAIGLGLLRLRHEARVDLSVVSDGRRVIVSARGKELEPGRGPNERGVDETTRRFP
jgi:hypothetical protein